MTQLEAKCLSCVLPISGFSNVTVCLCGFPRWLGVLQEIESNKTLPKVALPPHGTQPPNTHKCTHRLSFCSFYSSFLGAQKSIHVCSVILPFVVFPAYFRVTPPPVQANQGETSTTLWFCTTTTVLAGRNRSNCPSRWTCSGDLTFALSFGTAPVSPNCITLRLLPEWLCEHQVSNTLKGLWCFILQPLINLRSLSTFCW